MIVVNCSTPEKAKPNHLSFDQIKKEEGVYRTTKSDYDSYIITVRSATGQSAVLYYHPITGKLEPANPRAWESHTFIREVDKRVCFDLK